MNHDAQLPGSPPKVTHLVMILLMTVALALVVRLWGLTTEPAWLDEVYSVLLSDGSADQILQANATDVHPPAYYLGLAYWRSHFGSSPAGIRGYSILWSLITVALVVLLAAASGLSWRSVSLAGLLVAINPLDIFFAQEARMYTQAAALGVASTWVLWRWLADRVDNRSRLLQGMWLATYATAAALLLQTLYLGAFLLLAQGLIASILLIHRRDFRGLSHYAGASLISGLLFLPWLSYLQSHGPHKLGRLDWISAPTATDLLSPFYRQFYVGRMAPREPLHQVLLILAAALSISALVALVSKWSQQGPQRGAAAYLAWMTCVPISLAFLVSHLYRPVYFPGRFPVLVLPTFLVLTAIAAEWMRRLPWRMVFVALVVAVMAVGGAVQAKQQTKPGMARFAELYRQQGPPDHVVLLPPDSTITASYELGFPLVNSQQRQIQSSIDSQDETVIWVGVRQDYLENADPRVRRVYEWLLSLGPSERLAELDRMEIWTIRVRNSSRS